MRRKALDIRSWFADALPCGRGTRRFGVPDAGGGEVPIHARVQVAQAAGALAPGRLAPAAGPGHGLLGRADRTHGARRCEGAPGARLPEPPPAAAVGVALGGFPAGRRRRARLREPLPRGRQAIAQRQVLETCHEARGEPLGNARELHLLEATEELAEERAL